MAKDSWNTQAKRWLKSQMALKGIPTKQLADLLRNLGVDMTDGALANKISRGGFSATFFLQCCVVLGLESIDLKDFRKLPPVKGEGDAK